VRVWAAAIALGCAAMVHQPSAAPQVLRSWSDVRSISSWDDTVVNILVPGSSTIPSGDVRVPAKTISVRTAPGVAPQSFIAVSDPDTSEAFVVYGKQMFVRTRAGISAIQLVEGSLNIRTAFVRVPAAAGGQVAAITKFGEEFSPARLASTGPTTALNLVPHAPIDILATPLIGNWRVYAAIDTYGPLLRLEFLAPSGRISIDPERWSVVKSDFPAMGGPFARFPLYEPPPVTTIVRSLLELRRTEAWESTRIDLVVPRSNGSETKIEKIDVRSVSFQRTPLTPMFVLSVIPNRRSGLVHFIRGYQSFYIADGDDLWACLMSSSDVLLEKSYSKTRMKSARDELPIASFISEFNEDRISQADQKRTRISLRPGVPAAFFHLKSDSGTSVGGHLTVIAIDITDRTLRLDLVSDFRRYSGTFWIDLDAQKLTRTVVDGKEVFKDK
jgi:hypothetical protein